MKQGKLHHRNDLFGWRAGALALVLGLLCVAFSPSVKASSTIDALTGDALWDQSQLCQSLFARIERKEAIPIYLLSAIAVTESGRHHHASGMRIPWPWTVQAQGKGSYYANKQEAMAEVRRLQRKGVRSIDVGCMQVNLRYHGKAFSTLEQAFDPHYNVAYAAKYLKQHYANYGSWRKSLAAYHAGRASRGKPYSRRVMRAWHEVMTRSVNEDGLSLAARTRKARAPLHAQYDPENWGVRNNAQSGVIVLNNTPLQETASYPAPTPSYKPSIDNVEDELAIAATEPVKEAQLASAGDVVSDAVMEESVPAVTAAVVAKDTPKIEISDAMLNTGAYIENPIIIPPPKEAVELKEAIVEQLAMQALEEQQAQALEERKDNMLRKSDHILIQDKAVQVVAEADQAPMVIEGKPAAKPIIARGFSEAGQATQEIAFHAPAKMYAEPGEPRNLKLQTIDVASVHPVAKPYKQKDNPRSVGHVLHNVRMIFGE